MKIGDSMIWLCQARGGYGYVQRVKATVVQVGAKRVKIEVEQIHTLGFRRKVHKFVKPERLVPADTPERDG